MMIPNGKIEKLGAIEKLKFEFSAFWRKNRTLMNAKVVDSYQAKANVT